MNNTRKLFSGIQEKCIDRFVTDVRIWVWDEETETKHERERTMNANTQATILKAELFALLNRYKELALRCATAVTPDDSRDEAYEQVDAAACELARVYDSLGPVFTDAFQDKPNFAFQI